MIDKQPIGIPPYPADFEENAKKNIQQAKNFIRKMQDDLPLPCHNNGCSGMWSVIKRRVE
jgi:hypothetical protein